MRKEQQPPLHTLLLHHRRHFPALTGNKFTKPTAIVLLLLFSYALGYLSAPSSNSLHSPSQSPIPVIDRTVAAENITAISADGDHYHFTTQCADPIPPNLVRHTILEKVFNGTSPYENFPPAHASGLLRPKRIKGWGSKGAVFENLIRRVQPNTIIEVGTFLGASAIHMAGLASRLGLETQILCVDDFRGWPGFHDRFRDMKMVNGDVTLLYQFIQNVVHVNATGSVLFVPFSTASALEKLCEWGVFGELIEIDAGHDFHSAWTDINRAYKVLRPGGVIFGHDYFAAADKKGVRRAVNFLPRSIDFGFKWTANTGSSGDSKWSWVKR